MRVIAVVMTTDMSLLSAQLKYLRSSLSEYIWVRLLKKRLKNAVISISNLFNRFKKKLENSW
jgi:hypothetical protein